MRKPAKRVSHDVAYPDTAPKRGSVWLDKAYLGYYALCGRVFVLAVVSSQLFVPNGAVSSAGHVRSLMQSLKFSLRKTDYVGCTRFSETTNNRTTQLFTTRSGLQGMPYHCRSPSSASRSADAAEASSSVAASVAASASASVACAVVGASPFSEMTVSVSISISFDNAEYVS